MFVCGKGTISIVNKTSHTILGGGFGIFACRLNLGLVISNLIMNLPYSMGNVCDQRDLTLAVRKLSEVASSSI